MARYLYSELAQAISAYHNCIKLDNTEWRDKWEDRVEYLAKNHLPSGSGFDGGTTVDIDSSHGDKLVLSTGYHHMNDGGVYDGWTYHTVTVTPSFIGDFNIRVSGRNRNDVKNYIGDQFYYDLTREVPEMEY
jgi:hypothetical protein